MIVYKIYRILTNILTIIIPLYVRNRIKNGKEDNERILERYGQSNLLRNKGKVIWFHAASIGESLSILPLVKHFNNDKSISQILISTGTVTSAKILKKKTNKKIIHQYIPYDVPHYIDKFLSHWKPSIAVFVESEIWPNFIYELKKRNIKSIIINGRMTPNSFKKWSYSNKFSEFLFSHFDACCAQNNDSAFFYKKLGIQNTINTGNLKFAYEPIKPKKNKFDELKAQLKYRKIFLAASTHPGEEEIIKNITINLKKSFKNILTIVVPRHTNRLDYFSSTKGLGLSVRSKNQKINSRTYLYLADTIGELNMFYKLADVIFIGGSLVKHGGQNPIEAAYEGKKIIHGIHIQNFPDVYNILKHLKFTQQVNNERQLEHYIKKALINLSKFNDGINVKKLKREGRTTVQEVAKVINQFIL